MFTTSYTTKRAYNGGQQCWDLSSDITKTSDPSPPTPNKVEFWAKWVRMSAFLATTLLGEVGERRDEPKAEQKIVLRSRVLRNNCLEGLFHTVPTSFVLHCSAKYSLNPGLLILIFRSYEIYYCTQWKEIFEIFLFKVGFKKSYPSFTYRFNLSFNCRLTLFRRGGSFGAMSTKFWRSCFSKFAFLKGFISIFTYYI